LFYQYKKLAEILNQIKNKESIGLNIGLNGIIRSKSNDITDWTKRLVTFLPNLSDNKEELKKNAKLIEHFRIIKV
jgi:hypothetical protein